MPPTPKAVQIDKPETPPHIRTKLDELWDKMEEGERFFSTLNATVQGMGKQVGTLGEDVRDLSRRMSDHEKANAARALDHAEAERALRVEIADLRADTNRKLDSLDERADRSERLLQVLVDRQPQAPPAEAQQQGPITAALGLPPRQRTGSTAAVAGGGVSLAAVLGVLAQIGGLPVAVQWALVAVAVMVGVTACVVVGVRMTRRD